MPLEKDARSIIDEKLLQAGWIVQDYADLDAYAGPGIAVREFPLSTGKADYLLLVDGEAVGVIEAKKEGFSLTGVHEQSVLYQVGRPVTSSVVRFVRFPLPFSYEATNNEIAFANGLDPIERSRMIFHFHRPQTLATWLKSAPMGISVLNNDLLRSCLQRMPALSRVGLRDCQFEAITNLERSMAENRPRALIQMATGSGKTYMAVSSVYRLIKYGKAQRVLFLVDRSNLGKQALNEFQQFVTPDDGRKFTDLYNVQLLVDNQLDPVADVCITTIQRLYSMLTGQPEPEGLTDDASLFEREEENGEKPPKEVRYSPRIPIEQFDVIFIDECHRSIYQEWRPVLEYFDAFLIGLTATPDVRSFAFFERNLVMEYLTERAVADGVNVDYDIFRIGTEITENGSVIEKGNVVQMRDRKTRRQSYETLQDDLEYDGGRLDYEVVSTDQLRTVLSTYRDELFTTLFPGRKEVPKTLIFAKDDSHAEDIVKMVREVFGKDNNFAKKITYRVTGVRPDELIRQFRNSYLPRIAVTVDMISTGTDVKPLEALLFMRSVKSRSFFEQMKGRGCRTIPDDEFQAVTPDARTKTHFVLVDAVGVTRRLKSDNPPLERNASITFEKLLDMVAAGNYDDAMLSSLAGRLGRLTKRVTPDETIQIRQLTGNTLPTLAERLVDATDYDTWVARARENTGQQNPDTLAIEEAKLELTQEAVRPFQDQALRSLLIRIHERDKQTIDDISLDRPRQVGWEVETAERALQVITSFHAYMEQHKDEILAFELAFKRPRGTTLIQMVEQFVAAIKAPGMRLTTDEIWRAYQKLDASRVRTRGPKKALTDIIALVRYTMERETNDAALLEPYRDVVNRRFNDWLTEQQSRRNQPFTAEQLRWLELMRDRIATDLSIEEQDFNTDPFQQEGGRIGARRVFGDELATIMQEMNERLVA